MRCQKCGYALWNLREARCPECGEPFDARQWEFAPETVRFECPHCAAELPAMPRRGIWDRCGKCDRKFRWRGVTVVPLVDEAETRAQLRRPVREPPPFAWAYAASLLILGLILSGLFAPAFAHTGPPSGPVAGVVLALLVGALCSWGGVCLASVKYRRRNVVVWTLLFLAYSTIPISYAIDTHASRMSHFQWTRTALPMQAAWQALSLYVDEHGDLPPSLVLLVTDEYIAFESIVAFKSRTRPSDVRIGDLTLDMWERGQVTSQEFREAAQANPSRRGWEQLGDFLLARERPSDLNSESIAVGLSPVVGASATRYVLFASGLYELVHVDSHWISWQNQVRQAHGLSPLPVELP